MGRREGEGEGDGEGGGLRLWRRRIVVRLELRRWHLGENCRCESFEGLMIESGHAALRCVMQLDTVATFIRSYLPTFRLD